MSTRFWVCYVLIFVALMALAPGQWGMWAGMLAVAVLVLTFPNV